MAAIPTASQTVGPYWSIGLDWPEAWQVAPEGVAGERFLLTGRLLDGQGQPVPDGVLELWQANAEGRYAHPEDRQNQPLDPRFLGFGRCGTAPDGSFRFASIRPGPVPAAAGGLQAPHLVIGVFARGLLRRLATRVYFPDEPANAADPVLALVAPERRATLIATAAGPGRFTWDVRLQGAGETVFFEF